MATTLNGDGSGEAPGGGIKSQINLPWPKAIEIAMNALKIRFGRSLITASGIFLSVAFLAYSGGNYLLVQGTMEERQRQLWLIVMAFLVCFVGIMNAMLMSVSERFREIGTMKCLGALDSLVLRLFMIEALFMGIVASVAGWLLGFLVLFLSRLATLGWADAVHPMNGMFFLKDVVGSIAAGSLITLFAALLPARRAAQMPPAAALRSEV